MELRTEGNRIICRCNYCGVVFDVPASSYGKIRRPRTYCTPRCKPSTQVKRISDGRKSRSKYPDVIHKDCKACGRRFSIEPGQSPLRVYCRLKCRADARRATRRAGVSAASNRPTCAVCMIDMSHLRKGRITCSTKCRAERHKQLHGAKPVTLKCEICFVTFIVHGIARPKTCSPVCARARKFCQANPKCRPQSVLLELMRMETLTVCDACGQKPKPIRDGRSPFVVDHNHRTGRIRGVLCHRCNKIEGMLAGDWRVMREIVSWLHANAMLEAVE